MPANIRWDLIRHLKVNYYVILQQYVYFNTTTESVYVTFLREVKK